VVNGNDQLLTQARQVIAAVTDPEMPTLSIVDLGIVRSIEEEDGAILVTITPTYSGCPAMHLIEREICESLRAAGIDQVKVTKVLAPPWTTEWITETGKAKLREAGISPPGAVLEHIPAVFELPDRLVQCPLCGSDQAKLVSEFGSTACKSMYSCGTCLSTFEHMKSI